MFNDAINSNANYIGITSFNEWPCLSATARSNKVATTLATQDFSQLKKDYGKELTDVIINITGNIFSGQVMGETAKLLSERFGKIMLDRQSVSVNRADTSISHSRQPDSAFRILPGFLFLSFRISLKGSHVPNLNE